MRPLLDHGATAELEALRPMVMACLRWLPTSRPSASAVVAQLSISLAEVTPPATSKSSNKRTAAVANLGNVSLDGSPSKQKAVSLSQAERSLVASPKAGESSERSDKTLPPCSVPGCDRHRLQSLSQTHQSVCWRHLHELFPPEIKLVAALAKAGILSRLQPCDLVAAVWRLPPKTPLLISTIVYFLKMPGAIQRFMAALPWCQSKGFRGLCAQSLHGALAAAI